jgi:hypothetical protein
MLGRVFRLRCLLLSVTTGLKPVVTERGCLVGLSSVSPLLRVDFRLRVGQSSDCVQLLSMGALPICLNQDSLD